MKMIISKILMIISRRINLTENINMPTTAELREYIELLTLAKDKYTELMELQEEPVSIEFLSISNVCDILKCNIKTALKLFNDPEFPCENYGKEKKILAKEFIRYFSVRRDKNKSLYWLNAA